jgi:acetolactate synthase-1/2/3 large subunit
MNNQLRGRERTAGQVVVDTLLSNGITRGYCVPGESYLGLLEAVREVGDAFDLVVCRHEGGASYMAEASGRMTGLPGVCMVTRGPGACNAAIGLHTAQHEGTPLLLLVGDVTTGTKGRSAFQDIDLKAFFGGIAKKVFQVESAESVEHVMRQALQVAMAGKPGPVVVALPEDIQFVSVETTPILPIGPVVTAPSNEAIATLLTKLQSATKPLLVVGGTQWSPQARADILSFAERLDLPLACTFRRQDLVDNDSPCFVGSIGVITPPALSSYLEETDLLVLLDGQLGEIETARYSRLTSVDEGRYFVHVSPAVEELGLVLQPNLAIASAVEPVCRALVAAPTVDNAAWSGRRRQLREAYLAFRRPVEFQGRINPGHAIERLSRELPPDSVVTLGAGNYTHFVLRHHELRVAATLLAPVCAPMGYSVPAGIAAALEAPEREVVAYAGDGCFLMNSQELVTAAQRKLRLCIVMLNNGVYGSIRMHQELKYPGRPIATSLHNPDFLLYAQSMGIPSRRVQQQDDLVDAWRQLRKNYDGPIFIELVTDADIISPAKLIESAPATAIAA